MNYKLDQKKFDDIYFEGKPMNDKVNGCLLYTSPSPRDP